MKLSEVTTDKVMKIYSGRPGCACGCRGKYRYNPVNLEIGKKDRGYEVSDDEISATSVKNVLAKLQAMPDELVLACGNFFYTEHGPTVYTVYLLPDLKAKK